MVFEDVIVVPVLLEDHEVYLYQCPFSNLSTITLIATVQVILALVVPPAVILPVPAFPI